MDISVGDTFFADYPKNDPHLLFVILDICDREPNLFMCAMLSSWKDNSPYCDSACIVEKGEHPFVKHKSYIAYRETLILTHDEMNWLVENGKFQKKEPASPGLIKRIIESAPKSRKIMPDIRNFILDRYFFS